jgi:hypothetical protein
MISRSLAAPAFFCAPTLSLAAEAFTSNGISPLPETLASVRQGGQQ